MLEGSLLSQIYAAHRYLSALESVPKDYGTGELLYSSDIHTLVAVQRKPGLNLTTLANDLGVSKPAASKFVAKLLQRGYLTKSKAPDNNRDVLFDLTASGRTAAEGHARFEADTFGPLARMEESLPSAEREVVAAYFSKLFTLIG